MTSFRNSPEMTRRGFLQALGASAIAAGVALPVGLNGTWDLAWCGDMHLSSTSLSAILQETFAEARPPDIMFVPEWVAEAMRQHGA